jgi:transcriptional regulator with XRE-family HTH domain
MMNKNKQTRDESSNIFGNEVRRLRKMRGLSQVELAVLSSVSLGLVSQIETGRHLNPSARIIHNLDRALKAHGRLQDLIFKSLS